MASVMTEGEMKLQLKGGFTSSAHLHFLKLSFKNAESILKELKNAYYRADPKDIVATDKFYLCFFRLMSIQDQSIKLLDPLRAHKYFSQIKIGGNDPLYTVYTKLNTLTGQSRKDSADGSRPFKIRQLWNVLKHEEIIPVGSQVKVLPSPSQSEGTMIYSLGGLCDNLVSEILDPLLDCTKQWINAIIPKINSTEDLLT